MSYWAKRLQEQQDKLYDKTLATTNQQLANYYKGALDDISNDISSLYDALMKQSEDGTVKVNDLYRYNRYFEIRNKLNTLLMQLGQKEVKLTEVGLTSLYKVTSNLVGEVIGDKSVSASFTLVQDVGAQKVLQSVWCADGKHWTNRIWDNKTKLQARIEKGLVDCVSRGVPKDELVKQLVNDFGVGFRDADRIARTELTHVQNQAATDRYVAAGIEQYKFISAKDERTSDICAKLNGKMFYFKDAVIGVNMPPMHVNCRSTIVPVIK